MTEPAYTLRCLNPVVYAVYDETGLHVGNLKRIGEVWKFKAIGYDADGHVEPGCGPLTLRHNLVCAAPSAQAFGEALNEALNEARH